MTTTRTRGPLVATLALAALLGTAQAPALAATGSTGSAAAPSAAAAPVAPAAKGTLTSSIEGTWTGQDGRRGTVTGRFTPTRFARQGDGLVAEGRLRMVVRRADGSIRQVLRRTVVVPVQLPTAAATGAAAGTAEAQVACNILNLDLGPLDLNLLGLRIQLNEINLDITAIPGGGLLGDLLCAVNGLLSGGVLGNVLNQLANLLNRILGILSAR